MIETLSGPSALSYRQAEDGDLAELVRLRDTAARWQMERGIDQWRPGELGEDHFRARLREGEVWLATIGPDGPLVGAWELWWDDPGAWGEQPPVAGYIHRLMIDRRTAPPAAGRRMLAEAERRIGAWGRPLARLDCLATNPRLRTYYQEAGYTAVGEQQGKRAIDGKRYAVTLLEKTLPAHDA
ncbi:N-acetyltransferase [Streptomyces litchfieldiae]|uniref:N-acetyltransferase n=1 Tax=Streptomyces litchfieldiae TaxID=3075543 RepID=A0ABU2MTA0_9ACTN|nr:N-acetyltransferase [Streptomyces sp. DSM 44938]MDT0344548.1 N-acetyltransferase [Streptomyces sp. DSM 44938]